MRKDTGTAVVFDPSVFYGHNEYDLGIWFSSRRKFGGKAYIEEYVKYFPPAEPVEEFWDRILLYAM